MVLWKTKDDTEGMGVQGRLSGIHEQVDGCLMGAAGRRRQNTEGIRKKAQRCEVMAPVHCGNFQVPCQDQQV